MNALKSCQHYVSNIRIHFEGYGYIQYNAVYIANNIEQINVTVVLHLAESTCTINCYVMLLKGF